MRRQVAVAVLCAMGLAGLCRAGEANAGGPEYEPETTVAELPGYELVWNDEFDVDGPPDASKWNFEKGFCRNREDFRDRSQDCNAFLFIRRVRNR